MTFTTNKINQEIKVDRGCPKKNKGERK